MSVGGTKNRLNYTIVYYICWKEVHHEVGTDKYKKATNISLALNSSKRNVTLFVRPHKEPKGRNWIYKFNLSHFLSEKVEFWKPAESSNMSSKFIMSVVGTEKKVLYNVEMEVP